MLVKWYRPDHKITNVFTVKRKDLPPSNGVPIMCIYWLYRKNGPCQVQSYYSFHAALTAGCHYQSEGFKITRQLNNEETDVFVSGGWTE